MQCVEVVRALPGVGLEGDRYAAGAGTFSSAPTMSVRDVSMVALETLTAVSEGVGRALTPGELRRNLVIEGLELAQYLGATLRIGNVLLECTGHCPPCAHLDRLLGFDAQPLLKNRGGLRARILAGGDLVAGTEIEVVTPPKSLP